MRLGEILRIDYEDLYELDAETLRRYQLQMGKAYRDAMRDIRDAMGKGIYKVPERRLRFAADTKLQYDAICSALVVVEGRMAGRL